MGAMMERERMVLTVSIKAHPQDLDMIETRIREGLEWTRDLLDEVDTLEVVRTK